MFLKVWKLAPGGERGRMRLKKVSMRPPSVFVRELAPAEGQRLKSISKRAKHPSTRQRVIILFASATLMSPPEIARTLMSDESHVRKVIYYFKRARVRVAAPRFRGGRPRRISDEPTCAFSSICANVSSLSGFLVVAA